jgi:DNA polymerase-3 subunit beta
MKATCDKEDLLQSVTIVQRAMPSRSPMEIIENIHVRAHENAIVLRCTDTVLSIEDSLPAIVEEGGEIVLPGRLFAEIVRKLPQGAVLIEVNDTTVNIACGASDMQLAGIDAAGFPALPPISKTKPFRLAQNRLKNLILTTNFAVAQEETQPILTGALLEADATGVNMVALDGYRMAIAHQPMQNDAATNAVLPGKALAEVAKLLDDSEKEVEICFERTQASIELGQTRIITRLLEGDFINYRQILPTSRQTRIRVESAKLADAVERASLLAREGRNNLIKLEIGEHSVLISANGERGHIREEVDTMFMEGKALAIAFNAKYLLDVLRVIRDEEVLMDFISDRSPCVIRPTDGDGYLFIVLPVRISA